MEIINGQEFDVIGDELNKKDGSSSTRESRPTIDIENEYTQKRRGAID